MPDDSSKLERINLPEIEGILVPNYVKQIASGRYPRNTMINFPSNQPALVKIQAELVSYQINKYIIIKPIIW